jgi:hypothetical protein
MTLRRSACYGLRRVDFLGHVQLPFSYGLVLPFIRLSIHRPTLAGAFSALEVLDS